MSAAQISQLSIPWFDESIIQVAHNRLLNPPMVPVSPDEDVENWRHQVADAMRLAAAKQQLRTMMKQRLNAVSRETVEQESAIVCQTLQTLPAYTSARRVSIFLSMPAGEVQTDAIVRHALSAGKEVFVPFLYREPPPEQDIRTVKLEEELLPSRVMDMVRLRDLRDYEDLMPDKWGIPSLDPASVSGRQRALGNTMEEGEAQESGGLLDLILLPGLAFDVEPTTRAVRRLGHGKGFYDYFIHRHEAKCAKLLRAASTHQVVQPMLRYGLALSEQFLSSPTVGEVPVGPLDQPLHGVILGSGNIIEKR